MDSGVVGQSPPGVGWDTHEEGISGQRVCQDRKAWWPLVECYCCLVALSCLTLCNPMDCSPPGSSVHRNFQARILELVAISFSRESSQSRDRTSIPCNSSAVQAESLLLSHQGSPANHTVTHDIFLREGARTGITAKGVNQDSVWDLFKFTRICEG